MVEKSMKTVKNKKEQIIVRLDAKKKAQLQEIADSRHINMSKLIRDKIDEIIDEYKFSKDKDGNLYDNKTIFELSNKGMGYKNLFEGTSTSNGEIHMPREDYSFVDKLMDAKTISEIQDGFKDMILKKMMYDIEKTSFDEVIKKSKEELKGKL